MTCAGDLLYLRMDYSEIVRNYYVQGMIVTYLSAMLTSAGFLILRPLARGE